MRNPEEDINIDDYYRWPEAVLSYIQENPREIRSFLLAEKYIFSKQALPNNLVEWQTAARAYKFRHLCGLTEEQRGIFLLGSLKGMGADSNINRFLVQNQLFNRNLLSLIFSMGELNDKQKLVFLVGCRSGMGFNSSINQFLIQDEIYDRNLLKLIFQPDLASRCYYQAQDRNLKKQPNTDNKQLEDQLAIENKAFDRTLVCQALTHLCQSHGLNLTAGLGYIDLSQDNEKQAIFENLLSALEKWKTNTERRPADIVYFVLKTADYDAVGILIDLENEKLYVVAPDEVSNLEQIEDLLIKASFNRCKDLNLFYCDNNITGVFWGLFGALRFCVLSREKALVLVKDCVDDAELAACINANMQKPGLFYKVNRIDQADLSTTLSIIIERTLQAAETHHSHPDDAKLSHSISLTVAPSIVNSATAFSAESLDTRNTDTNESKSESKSTSSAAHVAGIFAGGDNGCADSSHQSAENQLDL